MEEKTVDKFLRVLKTGDQYDAERIQEELEDYISTHTSQHWANHDFRFDCDDKYHYIYDNECYLFVEDYKVTVRCDRERVESEGVNHVIRVKNRKDLVKAYETFYYMTLEDERDEL